MASLFWKVNFFFKGFSQGWSETLYFESSQLVSVRAVAQDLAVKRAGCLVDGYRLHACRITNEDNDRDSLLWDPGLIGVFDETPDYPGSSLFLRVGASNQYWRGLYFRGVPDAVINVTRNSDPVWVAAWMQLFNKWLLALLGPGNSPAGWKMKVIDKGTGTPKIDILTIVDLGNGLIAITTTAPHGLAVGNTAIIYNVRGLPTPLGRKQVKVVTNANVFEISGSLPEGFFYTGTGKVRKFTPAYPTITRCEPAGGTHRNTGRPFGQQRGSRRRRLV